MPSDSQQENMKNRALLTSPDGFTEHYLWFSNGSSTLEKFGDSIDQYVPLGAIVPTNHQAISEEFPSISRHELLGC